MASGSNISLYLVIILGFIVGWVTGVPIWMVVVGGAVYFLGRAALRSGRSSSNSSSRSSRGSSNSDSDSMLSRLASGAKEKAGGAIPSTDSGTSVDVSMPEFNRVKQGLSAASGKISDASDKASDLVSREEKIEQEVSEIEKQFNQLKGNDLEQAAEKILNNDQVGEKVKKEVRTIQSEIEKLESDEYSLIEAIEEVKDEEETEIEELQQLLESEQDIEQKVEQIAQKQEEKQKKLNKLRNRLDKVSGTVQQKMEQARKLRNRGEENKARQLMQQAAQKKEELVDIEKRAEQAKRGSVETMNTLRDLRGRVEQTLSGVKETVKENKHVKSILSRVRGKEEEVENETSEVENDVKALEGDGGEQLALPFGEEAKKDEKEEQEIEVAESDEEDVMNELDAEAQELESSAEDEENVVYIELENAKKQEKEAEEIEQEAAELEEGIEEFEKEEEGKRQQNVEVKKDLREIFEKTYVRSNTRRSSGDFTVHDYLVRSLLNASIEVFDHNPKYEATAKEASRRMGESLYEASDQKQVKELYVAWENSPEVREINLQPASPPGKFQEWMELSPSERQRRIEPLEQKVKEVDQEFTSPFFMDYYLEQLDEIDIPELDFNNAVVSYLFYSLMNAFVALGGRDLGGRKQQGMY